jgi:putative FmdB family regulatory protein
MEQDQRITEAPLKTCPACGQDQLERLISATSFQLKGSGWYKDGYGAKKGGHRTENQRIDRLQKAIDDDKKKSSTPSGSSESSSGDSSDKKASST